MHQLLMRELDLARTHQQVLIWRSNIHQPRQDGVAMLRLLDLFSGFPRQQ